MLKVAKKSYGEGVEIFPKQESKNLLIKKNIGVG
jgi:hypothetical protein